MHQPTEIDKPQTINMVINLSLRVTVWETGLLYHYVNTGLST
jgi:hypothetical protein